MEEATLVVVLANGVIDVRPPSSEKEKAKKERDEVNHFGLMVFISLVMLVLTNLLVGRDNKFVAAAAVAFAAHDYIKTCWIFSII